MNKPDDAMTDPILSGHPVPFCKPRMMPGGWDLTSQPQRQSTNGSHSDSGEMDESEEDPSSSSSGQAQKFTQPRTIPKGWDTSVLK